MQEIRANHLNRKLLKYVSNNLIVGIPLGNSRPRGISLGILINKLFEEVYDLSHLSLFLAFYYTLMSLLKFTIIGSSCAIYAFVINMLVVKGV